MINGRPSKIHRQAAIAVAGAEGARGARHSLAGLANMASSIRRPPQNLVQLKAALEAAIGCGGLCSARTFRARPFAISFRSRARFGGQTRFMALGDYSNSRGAADMGVLPDRLPGYAHLSDAAERARFGKIWGGAIPSAPGLTARAMMEAAVAGKLKALYVVGANPLKTFARRRAGPARPASNCWSCRTCSSPKPRSAPTWCCPPPPLTKKTAR